VTTIHHGLGVHPSGLGSVASEKTQTSLGQATAATPAQPGGEAPTSPEVQITSAAQLLAAVERQLANTPEVDSGRVDATRQALSEGSYQVDSEQVADGLLAAQNLTAQAAAGTLAQPQSLKAFASTAQLGPDQGS